MCGGVSVWGGCGCGGSVCGGRDVNVCGGRDVNVCEVCVEGRDVKV